MQSDLFAWDLRSFESASTRFVVSEDKDDYDDEASRRATVAPASGDVLMTAREADSDTRTETTEDGGKKNDKIMK